MALPLVLLPGLDGTGLLFEPLTKSAPADIRPIVIPLPELAAYDQLFDAIRAQLPAEPFAILGDSFAGPLALMVARACSDRVVAVILCNTFASAPLTRLLRFFPWKLIFLLPRPRWAIRRWFVGRDASPELVSLARIAVARTPRRILAARMRAVFSLPRPDFRIDAPMLVLSGSEDVFVRTDVRELERIASRVVHRSIRGPHLLLQAAPVEAWRAITAFLNEVT